MPSEGQFLPEIAELMREKPWNAEHPLPWPEIKAAWEKHWDHSKPILLEKSPPNLIRAKAIADHFSPSKFVVMVRNPYAHAEGLIRRNGFKIHRAANFAGMCLRTQWQNAQTLEDVMVITYEDLVADPGAACSRLAEFVPALHDMDHTASFEVHSVDGTLNRPIVDLNAKKIASLDNDTIDQLNQHFLAHEESFDAWGYDMIKTKSGQHHEK